MNHKKLKHFRRSRKSRPFRKYRFIKRNLKSKKKRSVSSPSRDIKKNNSIDIYTNSEDRERKMNAILNTKWFKLRDFQGNLVEYFLRFNLARTKKNNHLLLYLQLSKNRREPYFRARIPKHLIWILAEFFSYYKNMKQSKNSGIYIQNMGLVKFYLKENWKKWFKDLRYNVKE